MTTKESREIMHDKPADHYNAMVKMAGELRCLLEPSRENPTMLRGMCPFHEGTTMNNSRTLTIDARATSFKCEFCNARGNPIAFAAMVWGVTASDAHSLLNSVGDAVSAKRPPYTRQKPAGDGRKGRRYLDNTNTAVLTRAMRVYSSLLYTSYPALGMLARLGVDPHQAVLAGMGYCPGTGLVDRLKEMDVTEDELTETPLLREKTRAETFSGKIVLSDRDYTKATIWMTSMEAEPWSQTREWKKSKPHTYGVPGKKPQLFNLYSINDRATEAILTDDARLYIAMAAEGTAVTLITQRRRGDEDIVERAENYAKALMRRTQHLGILALAIHDDELRGALAKAAKSQKGRLKIHEHGGETIVAHLAPEFRSANMLVGRAKDTGPEPEEEPKAD